MKQQIKTTLAQLACVLLFCSFHSSADAAPNILFIFADDWGWGDLGCHDHPYVKTPNIDRLAAEGTDFHRFTVASGVCSPSRTAVMTGHFPARYNIDGHFAWVPSNAKRNMPDWLRTDVPTLPGILQSAGYRTAHFGKWHLSNDMIPDSPLPIEYGYDAFGAFNCAGQQMPVHEDTDRTIDFIKTCQQDNRPFFVNLWLHEPHTPHHVIPTYRWPVRDIEDDRDEIYAAVLAHADERVGHVLHTLDELDLADNTLVIFSSDNGPARTAESTELGLMYDTATGAGFNIAASRGVTGGRRGYKASLFEGGIGVPFIVRWPGKVAAGAIDNESLISAVDLLPTFCEIADATLPGDYVPDGVSQLAVLTGRPAPKRSKPLFWKYPARWPAPKGKADHWVSYAIVHDHWKLVANRDLSHVELYDIASDIAEANDVAIDHTDTVTQLTDRLREWIATLPDRPTGDVFSSLRDAESE